MHLDSMHLEYFGFSSGLRQILEQSSFIIAIGNMSRGLVPVAATLEDARIRGAYSGLHCCTSRSSACAALSRISFRSTPMRDLTCFCRLACARLRESGRSGCLRNRPHTARSERCRFSDHLYSLVESSIPGWRSAEICSARDDHGNLRTWTTRYIRCRRVIQCRPQHKQTDQIFSWFARTITPSG